MHRESNGHHTRQPNGFPIEDRHGAIDAMQSQSSEYVPPLAAWTSLEKSESVITTICSFIWKGWMTRTGISPPNSGWVARNARSVSSHPTTAFGIWRPLL